MKNVHAAGEIAIFQQSFNEMNKHCPELTKRRAQCDKAGGEGTGFEHWILKIAVCLKSPLFV